jgi:hypothetical protein
VVKDRRNKTPFGAKIMGERVYGFFISILAKALYAALQQCLERLSFCPAVSEGRCPLDGTREVILDD